MLRSSVGGGLAAVLVLTAIIGVGSPASGQVEAGVQVGSEGPQRSKQPRPTAAGGGGIVVIDFDDTREPGLFIQTTRLTDEFESLGVVFSGPGGNDGGAVLDESSNFAVTGQSSPNFLAFNTGAGMLDGGIPQGPETLTFDPPVSSVSINAGAGFGAVGTITMECFDNAGNLVGSDTITITSALQPLSVSARRIRTCVLSFTETLAVFDDLRFMQVDTILLDFETEDDWVTPIVNGQALSSPPEFGNLVAVNGFGPHTFGIAAFDSTPGGPNEGGPDPDLLVGLGNHLILQENGHQTVPDIYTNLDDAQLGGTMVFDFFEPVKLIMVDLIDICPGPPVQDVTITLFAQDAETRTYFVPGGWTNDLALDGPPGFDTLDLTTLDPQPGFMTTATASETPGFDDEDVVRLEVVFASSGALDNLEFDPDPGERTLVNGDVVLAVGDGMFEIRDNFGNFIKRIFDGQNGTFTTGVAHDADRNRLVTTDFSTSHVVVFDGNAPNPILNTIDVVPDGGLLPESVVVDAMGNLYVGHQSGDLDVKKYSPDGLFLDSYDVGTIFGSCILELAADQRTLFYTSNSNAVHRYDLITRIQLPDFVESAGDSLFGLELLPPFDGSTGLIVAGFQEVKHYDGFGTVVQTYDFPGASNWYGVSLDPDGTSFWATNAPDALYRFDIASGDLLQGPIVTGSFRNFGVQVIGSPDGSLPVQVRRSARPKGPPLDGGSRER